MAWTQYETRRTHHALNVARTLGTFVLALATAIALIPVAALVLYASLAALQWLLAP